MAALAEGDVYSPGGNNNKTIQLWKTLVNWISFLFRILLQFLSERRRAGFGNVSILWSSLNSSSGFKPLPAEYSAASPPPSPPQISLSTVVETPRKLTVVLDLDETLVCAYETSSLPVSIRNQATEAGLNWFEIECVTIDKEGEGIQKVNQVTVFERPGLAEFLKRTSEFADLILFTAGLEGYARPLVDKMDTHSRFSRRFYRPSTVSTEYRDHVKDLSCLTDDFRRVVLVDNNPFSFLLQPLNGIPCVPFAAGQPRDDQLLDVILPLLEHLSLQNDVRPVLYERFHMPEWFEKQGIPSCLQSPS